MLCYAMSSIVRACGVQAQNKNFYLISILTHLILSLPPVRRHRLEQENKSLLRKTRGRGVTADQVVGARRAEEELEELRRRNGELEAQIVAIR